MTGEAWAAIIAALITAIGTLIATKFDEITQLLTRSSRDVTGDWTVVSERVGDGSWVGDYDLKLRQSGAKVKGEMSATRVEEGKKPHNYTWLGKIVGEYLMYECTCTTPGTFMISTGMLHVHAAGEKMTGYFVANRGSDKPNRNWLGSAELMRKR